MYLWFKETQNHTLVVTEEICVDLKTPSLLQQPENTCFLSVSFFLSLYEVCSNPVSPLWRCLLLETWAQ